MSKRPQLNRRRPHLTEEAKQRLSNYKFEPTPEQRATVRAMASLLATHAEICQVIINPATGQPINQPTLVKYFSEEMSEGSGEANQKVTRALFQKALGKPALYGADGNLVQKAVEPDVAAAIWWEKSRLGYKEGTTVDHRGKDGADLNEKPSVIVMIPHNNRDPISPYAQVMTIDVEPKEVEQLPAPGNGKDNSWPH